jgi:sialidase-1
MSDRRWSRTALAAACGFIAGMACTWAAGAQGSPSPHWKVIVTDGGCGGFEAWPDVKRLDNGELLVAFYAGYAHGSPPTERLPRSGKMALVRSKDNGVTWGPVETIVDSRDDDHDGSLCQLHDGTLLCNYFVDIHYRLVDGKEVRGNW